MNYPQVLDLTPENIATYGVCGYKDSEKNLELKRKIKWVKKYYPLGLKIKALFFNNGGYQGMLEYIPGEYAHRPVDAKNYLFIHCIFIGFKKEFKHKGYGSLLIDECICDAKKSKKLGVAVVTRKGSFMARKDIFLKKGFSVVDKAEPDFELSVLKFNKSSKNPKFKDLKKNLKVYREGLYVLRSFQCPYTGKNVDAIKNTAKNIFGLDCNIIDLCDSAAVQNSPCAFGSFCIIYNGEIVSYHPISNTRFKNIMEKKVA